MSAFATVENGVITNQTDPLSKPKETPKNGSNLDKDAFLQLLVAQMKYQDPLEPTSNTEYISQLATFSELEEMQNVSHSMEQARASQLVGQYVFMNVTDSSGVTTYPEGVVDYVVFQNGKTFLSINDKLYNIDDLDTVADPEYLLAIRLAESFQTELAKLPKPELIKEEHLDKIKELMDVYDKMTSYQKGYISKEATELFEEYREVYGVMRPDEGGEGETEGGGDEGGSTEGDSSNDAAKIQ